MRELALLARRSLEEFFDDNCTQMAAAISYYVLFSLFPLLIFLVGVLGLLLQNSELQEDLVDAVLHSVPLTEDEGRDEVAEAVRGVAGVSSGALGVFGLIGMAWSGSNMFGVIRRSINTAYDLEQRRPFVQQKLLDLAMVLGLGMLFLASVVATGFLRTVRQFSSDMAVLGDAAESAGPAWDAASYLIPFGLSFIAFAVLYWVVPATKVRLGDVWPGALVAAVLFEAGKAGFAFYLENFSNYDIVYGSLGAVAAFLFWVYISANILLLGAEIASEYPRVRTGMYQPAAPPGPRPPLLDRARSFVLGLVVGKRKGNGTS
ncbi:MAG: YihY/virulence factor BrkB family protein [Dehalococcoidia bacterium]|nr:YihY/virulence factor BrkB family protein [Dehalococcoidia bacterium]